MFTGNKSCKHRSLAHMREPLRCLRVLLCVGRPRVTRSPSRVQTTTRSDTRSPRRCPPGLTRSGSACSVRWVASLRETERRVHYGGRRGSLPSLAPTRSNAHARVPISRTTLPPAPASVRERKLNPTAYELNNRPFRISLAAGPRHLSRPLTAETARMTGLTQATPPCERRQRPRPGTAVRGYPRPQAGQDLRIARSARITRNLRRIYQLRTPSGDMLSTKTDGHGRVMFCRFRHPVLWILQYGTAFICFHVDEKNAKS